MCRTPVPVSTSYTSRFRRAERAVYGSNTTLCNSLNIPPVPRSPGGIADLTIASFWAQSFVLLW